MTDRPQQVRDPDAAPTYAGTPGLADTDTHVGSSAVPGEPTELSLTYQAGLEIEARTQWAYARRRFMRHRLAMASLIVLILIALAAVFAKQVTPYGPTYSPLETGDIAALDELALSPTTKGKHYFGTDQIGRDYFSRVVYGVRTSLRVAFIVALVSTVIGTALGAAAGYFGGWLDNILMRLTDLVLTLPFLAVLLTASAFLGQGSPYRVAVIIALLVWTGLARIVRGTFLSLREKEFVEAAKASGSGDARIMFRHMLPNALGPIIVNATLIVAAAILIEAVLSFLGFGIQPPTPALGKLISEGQGEMIESWWLVLFPGLTIMLIVLCINFIGDGLRDALDPTQRRVRA